MAESHKQQNAKQQTGAQHRDPADVNMRAVGWGGVAVVGGILFAGAVAYFAYASLRPAADYGGPNAAANFKVDKPVLDSAAQTSRAAYFAEKEKLLNSYAWLDRNKGLARIPVEQAMRLMAERAGQQKGGAAP